MGFEHKGGRREGGGGFQREEFEITCADCQQKAKVPFKPRPDRPAYCRECYNSKHRDK